MSIRPIEDVTKFLNSCGLAYSQKTGGYQNNTLSIENINGYLSTKVEGSEIIFFEPQIFMHTFKRVCSKVAYPIFKGGNCDNK